MRMNRTFVALLAFGAMVAAATAYAQMSSGIFANGIVSEDGAIRLPDNFRTDFVMLGAWSVAGDADTGGEIGLHIVYAPKDAVDAYRQTGRFPDGTVLVKELFKGETESLTTGEATRAADVAGYFVMVKNDADRFPGHPLWGEGWGWAFFGAADTELAATENFRGECLSCHEPARSTDFVYVQAYPVLQ